jgi:hypothetical protein
MRSQITILIALIALVIANQNSLQRRLLSIKEADDTDGLIIKIPIKTLKPIYTISPVETPADTPAPTEAPVTEEPVTETLTPATIADDTTVAPVDVVTEDPVPTDAPTLAPGLSPTPEPTLAPGATPAPKPTTAKPVQTAGPVGTSKVTIPSPTTTTVAPTKNATSNSGDNNASQSQDQQTMLLKIWLPIVIVAAIVGLVICCIISAILIYHVRKTQMKKKEKRKMLATLAKAQEHQIAPKEPVPLPVAPGAFVPEVVVVSSDDLLPPPYTAEPEVPSQVDVICPITGEVFRDPVVLLESGNTYERSALESWLHTHDTDPITGAKLYTKTVQEDVKMQSYVKGWLQSEF